MSTEETSKKENTEVFYEESEAKDQSGEDQGDKETKPEQQAEDQSTGDKDESQSKEENSNSEDEAEGEGKEDKTADKEELKVEDLKVPDGVQLNAETVKEVYEQAKELGLNKTQAQAFLEARSVTQEQVESMAKASVESLKSVWLEEFKNDPEIGGDKALETAEHAKRAVEAFATEEFRKTLDDTGFGNHPEMLRMFSKIGKKMIANDSFISGKPVSTSTKSTADIFYGES